MISESAGFMPSASGKFRTPKGPFNNYVDKIRGEGVKKWQNSVHVVVE